jgi:acylphosphatase
MIEIDLAFRVEGRVQGVSYRAWTVRAANRLGVRGEVCNVGDGSVEGTVHGPPAAVDAFLAALRQGPPHADVRVVRILPCPPAASTKFEQAATRAAPAARWGADHDTAPST